MGVAKQRADHDRPQLVEEQGSELVGRLPVDLATLAVARLPTHESKLWVEKRRDSMGDLERKRLRKERKRTKNKYSS